MKMSEVKMKKSSNLICKPLFRVERKTNYLAMLLFALVASVLTFVSISLFPVMETILDKLPESIREMMPEHALEVSISSFFQADASQMWWFLGAVYATVLAIKLVWGNVRDGSADIVFSHGFSREQIIRTKVLRLVINIMWFNLICLVVSLAGLLIFGYGTFSIWKFFLVADIFLLISLIVGFIAFGLSMIFTNRSNPILGVALVILSFFILSISMISTKVEWLKYFTPFGAVLGSPFVDGFSGVEYITLAIWSAIAVLLMLLGIKKFKQADLVSTK